MLFKYFFRKIPRNFLLAMFLLFFFLHRSESYAQPQAYEQSGKQVYITVLTWIKSFESIKCTYRYRFERKGEWKEEEVTYKWQNNMEYYQSILLGSNRVDLEPIGSVMEESLVDGKGTLLGHQNQIISGEMNRKSFLYPENVRIFRNLFQKTPEEKIAKTSPGLFGIYTILSYPGTAMLANKEGNRVLMYWTQGEEMGGTGVNVYLDNQDRIFRIEYLRRPICSPEEVRKYASKDIFDIVMKISCVELQDYRQFDGIWFPCHIKERIYWATDESVKRVSRLKAVNGEISWCEYYVTQMEGLEYEEMAPIIEINIDPDTIQINMPLKKSDFEINIPGGTGMVDMETKEVRYTEHETWLERHADLLIILVALGILGGVTVAGWRYWLGKP